MGPFVALVLAGFLARFGYQMARSPVLPRFAQDLGAAPELIGLIVAAPTVTGVVIKLPAGALLALRSLWIIGSRDALRGASGGPRRCDPKATPSVVSFRVRRSSVHGAVRHGSLRFPSTRPGKTVCLSCPLRSVRLKKGS